MTTPRSLPDPAPDVLFEKIASILEGARTQVLRSVNQATVIAYWLIGCEIVQALQAGDTRAVYGQALVERLSGQLTARFGRGFSVANLKSFRQFYLVYAERCAVIGYPPGSQFEQGEPKSYPVGSQSPFHPNLSWSHYRALMRVEQMVARDFYEAEPDGCPQ